MPTDTPTAAELAAKLRKCDRSQEAIDIVYENGQAIADHLDRLAEVERDRVSESEMLEGMKEGFAVRIADIQARAETAEARVRELEAGTPGDGLSEKEAATIKEFRDETARVSVFGDGLICSTIIEASILLAFIDRLTRPSPSPGDWRTVESAPKDGTHILCYRVGEYKSAWWKPSGQDDLMHPGGGFGGIGWWYPIFSQPSHWMPLPPTPAAKGEADGR